MHDWRSPGPGPVDLAEHPEARSGDGRTVLVTGSSGLVGSALVAVLGISGYRVLRLVRRSPPAADEVVWDPEGGTVDAARLEGVEAVVHLAGENIAARRWTSAQKERIRASRVGGTGLLAVTLAGLTRPPRVLVSASAIGFYGDRGDEALAEDAEPGSGFLAETCRDWEAAVEPAATAGIRVVLPRIGVVLSAAGGALARMLPPFTWGLGGRLGSGRQFVSWIELADLLGILRRALEDDGLAGPVNAVSPHPVRNAELTRTLARVLRRPAWFPAPAAALRLALGEMGQELLLDGARVVPAGLHAAGFRFRHPDLESALRFQLGRPGARA